MTVEELIKRLQDIEDKSIEVWTTAEGHSEPLGCVTVGYEANEKICFVDNYYHDETPRKVVNNNKPSLTAVFWERKLVRQIYDESIFMDME